MRGGVDLHGGAEERVIADGDEADVEHDAVEVEEALFAEADVRAVVAEEGRLHPYIVAAGTEERSEDFAAAGLVGFARGVEVLAKVAGAVARDYELWVEWIVELA